MSTIQIITGGHTKACEITSIDMVAYPSAGTLDERKVTKLIFQGINARGYMLANVVIRLDKSHAEQLFHHLNQFA